MTSYPIGRSLETGETIAFPAKVLNTHLHLFGATGTGKTTFLRRLLSQMMIGVYPKHAMFVIDPLGGLARSLIDFISHPTMCTDSVRKRLIYVEPAKTAYVMPFNSLIYGDEDDLYFKTGRTSDCFLRSARSHDIEAMPRLRRWLYNCFFSVATMGYPPAAAQFLLRAGTGQHNTILQQLPPQLQMDWAEVLSAGSRERLTILDSTRNRTTPFFTCPILNRMLANVESRFDVERFIRERKIVIVNLDPQGKMDHHIANTMGGLMVNEILQQARNLPPSVVSPTALVLDEFQNFVSDDLYSALPETRQLGIELLLSHQSFSQLERADVDMRGIVWQARSRAIFCNDAEDADIMAHELASQTYNPMELKDQIEVFRQKKVGQERVWLSNLSRSDTSSQSTGTSTGTRSTNSTARREPYNPNSSITRTDGKSDGRDRSESHAEAHGRSEGMSETLVDVIEDFYETSSRTYYTFDEQMRRWARFVRQLKTGQALCKFRDDTHLHKVDVDNLVIPLTSQHRELRAKLLEENFQSDLFLPKEHVEQRWQRFQEELGAGQRPTMIDANDVQPNEHSADENDGEDSSVFR